LRKESHEKVGMNRPVGRIAKRGSETVRSG
jgi:hypothetical protein